MGVWWCMPIAPEKKTKGKGGRKGFFIEKGTKHLQSIFEV